ncbi:MAG: hypothetical protein HYX40_10880 [Sphingobacteriales bacterium]|nr:hypothetical protein [Sphingobacteriales bacterium]
MKLFVASLLSGLLLVSSCNDSPVASNKVRTFEERFKELEEGIRKNPDWLASIEKKAKEKNIPVDSMIKLDVTWMIDEQDGKHKQQAPATTADSATGANKKSYEERVREAEDAIRKNPDWLNSITLKAKDRKISVDSMIKIDAAWTIDEQDGKHKK